MHEYSSNAVRSDIDTFLGEYAEECVYTLLRAIMKERSHGRSVWIRDSIIELFQEEINGVAFLIVWDQIHKNIEDLRRKRCDGNRGFRERKRVLEREKRRRW